MEELFIILIGKNRLSTQNLKEYKKIKSSNYHELFDAVGLKQLSSCSLTLAAASSKIALNCSRIAAIKLTNSGLRQLSVSKQDHFCLKIVGNFINMDAIIGWLSPNAAISCLLSSKCHLGRILFFSLRCKNEQKQDKNLPPFYVMNYFCSFTFCCGKPLLASFKIGLEILCIKKIYIPLGKQHLNVNIQF